MNNAALNIQVQFFCVDVFSFLLRMCLGVASLAQLTILCLAFLRTPKVAALFYVLTYMCVYIYIYIYILRYEGSSFSISSPALVFVFDYSHPNGIKWFLVVLVCTSLTSNDAELVFMCLVAICICS